MIQSSVLCSSQFRPTVSRDSFSFVVSRESRRLLASSTSPFSHTLGTHFSAGSRPYQMYQSLYFLRISKS
jgi:hypothetical protein